MGAAECCPLLMPGAWGGIHKARPLMPGSETPSQIWEGRFALEALHHPVTAPQRV